MRWPGHRWTGGSTQIKVRVKQPGLEVRSRAGYWAPRAAEVARAKSAADAATLPPALEGALATLSPRNASHAVEIWTGIAPVAGGRTRVTVAWTPRETAGEPRSAPAEVSVTATSASGQAFEGRIDPSGTSFEAPPGSLRLTFTVRDTDREVIDRDVRTVVVPESGGTALALDDAGGLPRAQRGRYARRDVGASAGARGTEFRSHGSAAGPLRHVSAGSRTRGSPRRC